MGRRGSFFPVEVLAPAVGRGGRLGTTGCNQTPSSLVYLGATVTSTAAAAVITRASTRAPARVPLDTAGATSAKPSPTSTGTPMERVEGLTTLGALGATQLGGATLAVETSSLQAGSQTTPGLTEPAPQVVDMETVIKEQQHIKTTFMVMPLYYLRYYLQCFFTSQGNSVQFLFWLIFVAQFFPCTCT